VVSDAPSGDSFLRYSSLTIVNKNRRDVPISTT